jgi:tetratricopeptide (TPR) repeat protein
LSNRLLVLAILASLTCASRGLAAGQTDAFDCGALHDPDAFLVSDTAAAIAACTRIIQGVGTPRERAIASINRGIAHASEAKQAVSKSDFGESDRAAAAEDYDEAVKLDPKFSFAHYARGVGRLLGFLDDPLPDFDEAIRLDPDYALAYQGRARAAQLKRRFDSAIADYSVAIGLDPKLGRSFAGRGVSRRLKGDEDGAIADLTEGMRLTADDPDYRLWAAQNRGLAYLYKGDIDRAIADFGEVVRIKPDNSVGFFTRAIAQLMRGSFEPARADLQMAAELEPKNADIALWREIADRRSHARGNLAEAEKRLDMSAWPAAAIQTLLGEPTSLTLLEAANDDFAPAKERKTCAAYVYSGEFALLKAAKPEAVEAFKAAVGKCPAGAIERIVAAAELKSADAKP